MRPARHFASGSVVVFAISRAVLPARSTSRGRGWPWDGPAAANSRTVRASADADFMAALLKAGQIPCGCERGEKTGEGLAAPGYRPPPLRPKNTGTVRPSKSL